MLRMKADYGLWETIQIHVCFVVSFHLQWPVTQVLRCKMFCTFRMSCFCLKASLLLFVRLSLSVHRLILLQSYYLLVERFPSFWAASELPGEWTPESVICRSAVGSQGSGNEGGLPAQQLKAEKERLLCKPWQRGWNLLRAQRPAPAP